MSRTNLSLLCNARRNALTALALVSLLVASSAQAGSSVPQTSEFEVESGQSLKLSFVADANYRVADVRVDGFSVGAVESYELTGADKDVDVEVRFTSLLGGVVPAVAYPVSGATTTSLNPTLAVYNPLVAQTLSYEFEVALDAEFTQTVASHTTLTSLTDEETHTLVDFLAMN